MNLSIFSVFLKIETFFSKIRRSKVTDYAALNIYSISRNVSRGHRRTCCYEKKGYSHKTKNDSFYINKGQ